MDLFSAPRSKKALLVIVAIPLLVTTVGTLGFLLMLDGSNEYQTKTGETNSMNTSPKSDSVANEMLDSPNSTENANHSAPQPQVDIQNEDADIADADVNPAEPNEPVAEPINKSQQRTELRKITAEARRID